jgi:hypothetical protein
LRLLWKDVEEEYKKKKEEKTMDLYGSKIQVGLKAHLSNMSVNRVRQTWGHA